MDKAKTLETLQKLPPGKWGRESYYNEGHYCAVGWLAHEAGVTDEELDSLATLAPIDVSERMSNLLRLKYSIGSKEEFRLVDMNDNSYSYRDMIENFVGLFNEQI
jgi:hypothetical protein